MLRLSPEQEWVDFNTQINSTPAAPQEADLWNLTNETTSFLP